MRKTTLFIFLFYLINHSCISQPKVPVYTKKPILSEWDTSYYKEIFDYNGFCREYFISNYLAVTDIDDMKEGYLKWNVKALICEEGKRIAGLKQGEWNRYIFMGSKKVLINKLTYKDDKLNGESFRYTLGGHLVTKDTLVNDEFNGIGIEYWLDGSIWSETPKKNDKNEGLSKMYYTSIPKVIREERSYTNGDLKHIKVYYQNGVLKKEHDVEGEEAHGKYFYYHDNGQIWTERLYNKGKLIEVKFNYSREGKPQDIGTFKNGNGFLYSYDEKGNIIAKVNFINGKGQE